MEKKKRRDLSIQQQKSRCLQFLKSFQDSQIYQQDSAYSRYGKKKYLIKIQKIANLEKNSIDIEMEDLQEYFQKDEEQFMVRHFKTNTWRYIKMFEEIVSELMPERTKELSPEQETEQRYLTYLKIQRDENIRTENKQLKAKNQYIPFRMWQHYDVLIVYGPNSKQKLKTITDIQAGHIGSLITTRAIVVRSSEVRPQLVVGTYACDICGNENYQEVYDSSYKPNTQCLSSKCKQNQVMGRLTFLPGHSTFKSFQDLKIQQTPEQLQRGSIPKSIRLQLKGNMVNTGFPGDLVKVQGIILPKSRSKFSFNNDMSFDSYIYVTKIIRQKKKYTDIEINEQMNKKMQHLRQTVQDEQLFQMLAKSIAPQIYGMQNVKKALLLQMAGGITTQSDNLRIRGQINVALFGDPGIAKSQLLKHIAHISPRAVYTTGKGSSGVGLTAAVVTDPTTKELSLEAGALVLADMGVCCIDQFDKMEQYDRTAIHEVMEQQTVSITKAGIITTLNARTAVLAAANPLYGRYDKKQTVQKNLNLPAALLSRFDLIFILLDTAKAQQDLSLARHIGKVHQMKSGPKYDVLDQTFLKAYLSKCKTFEPIIPQELHDQMIKKYIEKRQLQLDASRQGDSYTTMRSLLALIRLSQARAKLRFSNEVSMTDVIECLQIIEESKIGIVFQAQKKMKADPLSNVYEMIKSFCAYSKDKKVQIEKFQKRAILKGYSKFEIENCIKQYEILGVLSTSDGFLSIIS